MIHCQRKSRIYFILFIICSVFINANSYAQENISIVKKYKEIGLVWGLLKYHHPEISRGKYNWDLEFVNLCDKIDGIKTQNEMNVFLLDFISKYSTNKIKTRENTQELLFSKNVDYSWIDQAVFGKQLTRTLVEIKENTAIHNFYVSTDRLAKMLNFKNEKGFKDFNYSIMNHRMLLLYSFWNAIQYWDVNKYLMDDLWSNNLDSMTEMFLNCNSNFEFEIAKSKLISKLNDSHSYYCSPKVFDSLFKYKPVFFVKSVNDSLVINSIYNQALAKKDGIELGDIITNINNKNIVTNLKEQIGPILSVSNINFLKKFSYWLLFNNKDSINVSLLKKDGTQINRIIHLFKKYEEGKAVYLDTERKDKWYLIKPDIAYINLDQINGKELRDAFKQIATTKGLILDLRNYPKYLSNNDIAEFLYPQNKEFIKVLFPIENHPSYGEYDGQAPLKLIANPFRAGSNNPNYYKGRVMLLVNKKTQSKAEYIGMTIQQSPNCLTIGEQTAGSVMNIVSYQLPDMTEVNFTGLGAFYPNGIEVQRNGLHIDFYVNESAKKYDSDLYIKEAIRLMEEKN